MAKANASPINNSVYDGLGDRWYSAQDDPVALLRAESACRAPWIAETLAASFARRPARVLDVGCGAGFLANALARAGHVVTGIDLSESSLAAGAQHDATRSVTYAHGDARTLPFATGTFDAVCAMDFLEHVDAPARVIAEAGRVLVPGGCFFFHTFNRTWLSWLVVIKGVEWFVRNTPKDLHVFHLFLKPAEVQAMCVAAEMTVTELRGLEPVALSGAFFRLLATGIVPPDFRFRFTSNPRIGFTGCARKNGTWSR